MPMNEVAAADAHTEPVNEFAAAEAHIEIAGPYISPTAASRQE